MARRTQRQIVLDLLRERGETGVGSRELIFQHGITRTAAIVHKLRTEDKLPIETKPGRSHDELAVYVLRAGQKVRPTPPPIPAQAGLLPDEEIPTVTWEQLGQRLRGAH